MVMMQDSMLVTGLEHAGGMIIGLLGLAAPELTPIGLAFMELANTYNNIQDEISGAVSPIASFLSGVGIIGNTALGIGASAGFSQDLSGKLYGLVLEEMKYVFNVENKPAAMPPIDCFPRGIYTGERLALNLGPLNAIGEAIASSAADGNPIASGLIDAIETVPFHGSSLMIYPKLDTTVAVTDKDGSPVVAYTRCVFFNEFSGTLDGAASQSGKGTLFNYEGIQYWDNAAALWYWVLDFSSYSGHAQTLLGGAASGWNAILNDKFFNVERSRHVLKRYTPIFRCEVFELFLDKYLSLAGRYNLFSFNCQDFAKELIDFSTKSIYPEWWLRNEVAESYFSVIDFLNTYYSWTLTPTEMNQIKVGLKTSDSEGEAYDFAYR
jgi:hypothetical protein